MDYSKAVRQFKALSDENRLQIIVSLQSGEKCACRLLEELSIGQPTLSHHMKILCDAGLVIGRREGKWTHYSLNRQGCAEMEALLAKLWSGEWAGEAANGACCRRSNA